MSIFCFQIFLIICFCCGILHGKRCKLKLCERWWQIGIAKNIQVKIEIVTKVNGFMNFTFLQIMCITEFEIMIPNISICVFVAIVQIHCCITTNYWQTKILDQLSCNVFVWKIFLFYKSFLVYVESFLVVDTSKSRKWKRFLTLSVPCQHFYGTQGFSFEIYDFKKIVS